MTENQLSDVHRKAVLDALLAGRKIEAIKQYREFTGVDLKTAKEAVEAMEAMADDVPDHRPDALKKTSGGCLSMVLFVVGVSSIAYWLT